MSRNKLLKKADEYVNNLSIGLGRGITNQLEGILSMIESPVQTAKGFAALASNPSQIPGMVRNALTETVSRGTSGPMGLGEVLGENFSPSMLRRAPVMREMTTYHGSPHKFDRFDNSKIGTGEGAQAYGHGIYLAEQPGTAKTYMTAGGTPAQGTARHYLSVYRDPEVAARVLEASKRSTTPESNKMVDEAAALLRSGQVDTGNFYTVDLPDQHIANMLNWDTPLEEQPHILRALGIEPRDMAAEDALMKKAWAEGRPADSYPEYKLLEAAMDKSRPYRSMTGAELYSQLADEAKLFDAANPQASWSAEKQYASNKLRELGIPGIRYLDGGSRGAGQGTSNFVVFDPSITTILNRE